MAEEDQIQYLDTLDEPIEAIWRSTLAARNKADAALDAVRDLRMQISQKKSDLLKRALEAAALCAEDKGNDA